MREKWARRIVFLTSLLVLLLAGVFAYIQNPAVISDVVEKRIESPSVNVLESNILDPELIEAGRQVYKQQSCARCHSISGKGNSRNPLDNVGARRTADELRNWIIGADSLQGSIPESVIKLKKPYRELSDYDLDILVIYLQHLRQ